jgi:hypothetical protein
LGFVKVLVTSLQPEKLLNLRADIVPGILKWSSFTKHHFKAKVNRTVPVFSCYILLCSVQGTYNNMSCCGVFAGCTNIGDIDQEMWI